MCCFLSVFAWADDGRTTISLNGEWDFDQTEHAFPPRKDTGSGIGAFSEA